MKKIGYVLSGGGVRGVAHLGVIQALNESGIKPDFIAGTSAGAIAGAFIAAGYHPKEIVQIIKDAGIFSFSNILFRKQGIFKMKAFEEIYKKYISHDSFENLNLPLYATATDIVKGEPVYFHSGILSKALMASSCVPVVFEPITIDGKLFLDGGIVNNLPVEPLIGKCDKIIGVHVNAISSNQADLHMKDLADRSFHLALSSAVRLKEKDCDLFIEPPEMTKFGMFDMDQIDEVYNYAYQYILGMKEQIEVFKKEL